MKLKRKAAAHRRRLLPDQSPGRWRNLTLRTAKIKRLFQAHVLQCNIIGLAGVSTSLLRRYCADAASRSRADAACSAQRIESLPIPSSQPVLQSAMEVKNTASVRRNVGGTEGLTQIIA